MTRAIRRLAAAGCTLATLLLVAPPVTAQVPDEFTNLKLLDKDIGKQELIGVMRDWAMGLGVRCNHCHVGPDNGAAKRGKTMLERMPQQGDG